jgi:acyl carrier protein
MSEPHLIADVQALFEQSLGLLAPDPEVDLVASGLLDSLALVTLLFELEQAFAIQLPLETLDVEDFRTLARIAGLVAASRGLGRAAA